MLVSETTYPSSTKREAIDLTKYLKLDDQDPEAGRTAAAACGRRPARSARCTSLGMSGI